MSIKFPDREPQLKTRLSEEGAEPASQATPTSPTTDVAAARNLITITGRKESCEAAKQALMVCIYILTEKNFQGGQSNVLRNRGGSWVGAKASQVKIGQSLGVGGGGGKTIFRRGEMPPPLKPPKKPGYLHIVEPLIKGTIYI